MALRLSVTSTPSFQISTPKHPRQLPFPLPLPLLGFQFKCCSTSISRSKAGAVQAVQQEQEVVHSPVSDSSSVPSSSSKLVLVIGGTGGVGQLVVASLLDRNIKCRLLLRDTAKATSLFGEQDQERMQVIKGDTRNPGDLDPSIFEGVTHVICCTGTTAFPSKRWSGDNTPEKVDWEGVRNLVSALPWSLKRVVLVSSVGVTKFNEFPWRCILL